MQRRRREEGCRQPVSLLLCADSVQSEGGTAKAHLSSSRSSSLASRQRSLRKRQSVNEAFRGRGRRGQQYSRTPGSAASPASRVPQALPAFPLNRIARLKVLYCTRNDARTGEPKSRGRASERLTFRCHSPLAARGSRNTRRRVGGLVGCSLRGTGRVLVCE